MTTIENIRRGGPAAYDPHSARAGETGAEELRRIVRVLGCCREDAISDFSAEDLIRLQRAAWASEWDVYVDDLSTDQTNAALLLSETPAFYDGPRGLVPVPSSMLPAAEVHDWLCHAGGGSCSEGLACGVVPDEERARAYREAQGARAARRRGEVAT